MSSHDPIDVVFSFDTTGSMYPCLTQVRRTIEATVKRLFTEVPNLRIGVTAHGDYCDRGETYVTKHLGLTTDQASITRFVQTVERTGGGDAPECYELVLHEARSFAWRAGRSKVLVLIGDDVPHGPTEGQNTKKLDWRNELDLLLEAGVKVYGVQALGRKHATKFYEEVARRTGGFHLNLDQFSEVTDLILAVCFNQLGPERVLAHQTEIEQSGRMTRSLSRTLTRLRGEEPMISVFGETDLRAVPPGRFQVMKVDKDMRIDEFVQDQGLVFTLGRGFYELTKSVIVQGTKEVVLRDRRTGDFFSGSRAREMVGLPTDDVDVRLRPLALDGYQVFIQSTSSNRKLIGGTSFLYEVPDWSM
jgi:hypothetical protein